MCLASLAMCHHPCASFHHDQRPFLINRSSLRNQLYLSALFYNVMDIASKNHFEMPEGKGEMYKLGVKQPGW